MINIYIYSDHKVTMKAQEIIQQYQEGRRDFRHLNLRGANFKGQDLSGADFSYCDIRGTNFNQANLTNVIFVGVKAGLQRIWLMIFFLYILLLMFVSGSFSGLIGYSISLIFNPNFENQMAAWSSLIFLIFFSAITHRKSLGMAIISGAVILTFLFGISLFGVNSVPFAVALVQTGWISSSIILIIIAVGTLSIALSMARAIK